MTSRYGGGDSNGYEDDDGNEDNDKVMNEIVIIPYMMKVIVMMMRYLNVSFARNWNVSRLVLQSSLYNALKPGVKSRMKMGLKYTNQILPQIDLNHMMLKPAYVGKINQS